MHSISGSKYCCYAICWLPDNVKCVHVPYHTAESVNKIISVEGVVIEVTTVDI
jgi:DNA replicative helicase MCM subunit Mcm2 (Cdc46/Mcm family)